MNTQPAPDAPAAPAHNIAVSYMWNDQNGRRTGCGTLLLSAPFTEIETAEQMVALIKAVRDAVPEPSSVAILAVFPLWGAGR